MKYHLPLTHPLLQTVDISVSFGGLQILDEVSIGIPEGSVTGLIGPNGAGKTTTFNMLAGVLQPTRGDAFIFGRSIRRQLRGVQSLIGLCPQHDVLWSELTADEHLQLFAGLSGVPEGDVGALIDTFLAQVDLTDWRHAPCKKYSGGMKRRLSVANACVRWTRSHDLWPVSAPCLLASISALSLPLLTTRRRRLDNCRLTSA